MKTGAADELDGAGSRGVLPAQSSMQGAGFLAALTVSSTEGKRLLVYTPEDRFLFCALELESAKECLYFGRAELPLQMRVGLRKTF